MKEYIDSLFGPETVEPEQDPTEETGWETLEPIDENEVGDAARIEEAGLTPVRLEDIVEAVSAQAWHEVLQDEEDPFVMPAAPQSRLPRPALKPGIYSPPVVTEISPPWAVDWADDLPVIESMNGKFVVAAPDGTGSDNRAKRSRSHDRNKIGLQQKKKAARQAKQTWN